MFSMLLLPIHLDSQLHAYTNMVTSLLSEESAQFLKKLSRSYRKLIRLLKEAVHTSKFHLTTVKIKILYGFAGNQITHAALGFAA